MKNNLYLNIVMGIIALNLTIISLDILSVFPSLKASNSYPDLKPEYGIVPLNEEGSIKIDLSQSGTLDVRIVDINTYDMLKVNLADISTSDKLDINLAKVSTSDKLNIRVKEIETQDELPVNIDEVGGHSVFMKVPVQIGE